MFIHLNNAYWFKRWTCIEHMTFKSSIWRSRNWAIPTTCKKTHSHTNFRHLNICKLNIPIIWLLCISKPTFPYNVYLETTSNYKTSFTCLSICTMLIVLYSKHGSNRWPIVLCGERGSNTWPSDLQSDALPTELSPQDVKTRYIYTNSHTN